MKNYDYWKKSQITDISTFCYWLHQKGVGIYASKYINSNRHSLHDSSQCLPQRTIFAKFMKMLISCLLKSIVSIKYFESDFLEKS